MKNLFKILVFAIVLFVVDGRCQSAQDSSFTAKIVQMDDPEIVIISGKGGYQYLTGFFHIKVQTESGKFITLLRLFNFLEENATYQKQFNLQVGERRFFTVYKFLPCSCPENIVKPTGRCEEGEFFSDVKQITSSYSEIYRVIGASPPIK
jgi:hypothetical protein